MAVLELSISPRPIDTTTAQIKNVLHTDPSSAGLEMTIIRLSIELVLLCHVVEQ